MELIVIMIVVAIVKFVNSTMEKAEQENRKYKNATYSMPKRTERTDSPRVQIQQQNEQWRQAARENIEKARQRSAKGIMKDRMVPKQEQSAQKEAYTTTILERAKVNASEDLPDVTLHMLEMEHNHSERVSPAEHHHPEDVISDNLLGSVEDLMVKGYDGNLCFERDFVGEAMDMLSRFVTIHTSVS